MPLPHHHAGDPEDAEDQAPARTTRRLGRRARVVRLTLVIYWLALFASTHVPPPELLISVNNIDKLMHLLAYAGLSFLLMTAYAHRRTLTAVNYAQILALVALYGIVDEVLQTFVGRDCEFGDWVADALGAAVGLACFHVVVYRRRRVKSSQ